MKYFCAFFLMSFSSVVAFDSLSQQAAEVTICEIKRDPQRFNGREVIVSALYRDDGRHFSLLTDEHCGSERTTLQVGTSDSPSARDLWARWQQICAGRGDQGYCVVTEKVRVHGRVRLSVDETFIDIESLHGLGADHERP